MTDPEAEPVRAFWDRLGLPGLIDFHVHFLPPPIERAVWRVFDSAGDKIGRPWPIRYRQPPEDRVALLRLRRPSFHDAAVRPQARRGDIPQRLVT